MNRLKPSVLPSSSILTQATQYFQEFIQSSILVQNPQQIKQIKQIFDYKLNDIKYSIERVNYQNRIWKKIQKIDQEKRNKLREMMKNKEQKVDSNFKKNYDNNKKKYKDIIKHVDQVHKKYEQQNKKRLLQQKQQSIKLRKQLQQFYMNQQKKLTKSYLHQSKVSTQYPNAVQRLNKIQKQNQQVSRRTQQELNNTFKKFNNNNNIFYKRSKTQGRLRKITNYDTMVNDINDINDINDNINNSNDNDNNNDKKTKEQVYMTFRSILQQNEQRSIQKCVQKQYSSIKAFEHKHVSNQKSKKRINQFFKSKLQKWREQRSKIEQKSLIIPQKCCMKIQRSQKSTFRNTISQNFRQTVDIWRQSGHINRQRIKQKDDKRKNQIIRKNIDIRLKNKSVKIIRQQMSSMRHRAGQVAKIQSQM